MLNQCLPYLTWRERFFRWILIFHYLHGYFICCAKSSSAQSSDSQYFEDSFIIDVVDWVKADEVSKLEEDIAEQVAHDSNEEKHITEVDKNDKEVRQWAPINNSEGHQLLYYGFCDNDIPSPNHKRPPSGEGHQLQKMRSEDAGQGQSCFASCWLVASIIQLLIPSFGLS